MDEYIVLGVGRHRRRLGLSESNYSLLGESKIIKSSDFAKKVWGTFKTPTGAIIDAWTENDAKEYRSREGYKEIFR